MASTTFGGTFERRFNPAPLLIAGLVLAGTALALGLLRIELYLMVVVLAMLAAAGAFVVSLASRWHGIEYFAIVLTGVLAPLPLPGGLNLTLLLAMAAVGWWLARQLLRRHFTVDPSPVAMATLAFIGVALLSFIVGQYPWFPAPGAPMRAQVGALALFVVSGSLLLAVAHQLTALSQLEKLTWAFIGAGGLFSLQQIAPPNALFAIVDRFTQPETVGAMFWTWIVAMSLGQAFFNTELSLMKRVAVGGVAAVALFRGLVVAFSWASGWLPPLVVVGVLVLLRFPRLAVAGGALALTPVLVMGGMAVDKVMSGESYSWMTRLEALNVVFEMLKTNPLLGFGPANYYHYTLLFPILGWWVRFNSHNNYIDLVAQTGLIGLAVFGWLMLELALMMMRVSRRPLDGFSRGYLKGALAGLVASLVAAALADWIVPFAYNIGTRGFRSSVLFWFFMGGALAIKRLTADDAWSEQAHA